VETAPAEEAEEDGRRPGPVSIENTARGETGAVQKRASERGV